MKKHKLIEEVSEAVIILMDKSSINLIDPKIKRKKGFIVMEGILNSTENNKDQLRKKLGINNQDGFGKLVIRGTSIHGSQFRIEKVFCKKITYNNLRVVLQSWGAFFEEVQLGHQPVKNTFSIGLEGLMMYHKEYTQTTKQRSIFGRPDEVPQDMIFDYTETTLDFVSPANTIEKVKIAFIQIHENLIKLRFDENPHLDWDFYRQNKRSLQAFLSYLAGNQLVIRTEEYNLENYNYYEVYSSKRVKKKTDNNYLPIHDFRFTHRNIFNEYFNCFGRFTVLDKELDLSGFIFLFLESQRKVIDTGIFIMLVALEKLAENLLRSNLLEKRPLNVSEKNDFQNRLKPVKETFKKSFRNHKDYNKYYSKLCNIYQPIKTNEKISHLMDYSEVKLTEDFSEIFPRLRNRAIHEGLVSTETKDGFENYQLLSLLCNRIVCNLIRYKGERLNDSFGSTVIETKTEYKIEDPLSQVL